MVKIWKTYPLFCKHLQNLHENGELEPPVPNDQRFYDWENDKPTRELILIMDNAPYHHGLQVQLNSLTKGDIAALLRELEVEEVQWEITTTNDDGNDVKLEFKELVPAENKDWKIGRPNA